MSDISSLYTDLVDLSEALLVARAAESQAYKAMRDTQAGIEYQAQVTECAEIERQRAEIDRQVRELALASYAENKDKHPHQHVEVRVNVAPVYQDEAALIWALSEPGKATGQFYKPVSLDERKFEKYARAVREVAPLPFVSWREVPVVAISLDGEE